MKAWLGRLVHRAARAGRRPLAVDAGLAALALWTRLPRRGKLPSVRQLEAANVQYYRQGLAAGHDSVWTSIFAPAELFRAFGLSPVCLEGLAGLLAASGAEQAFLQAPSPVAVPNTLCTFHRVLLGLGLSSLLSAPRAVVSASALCDGNNVSFRQLAARRGLPFRLLDIPPEPSGPAVAYLVEQLRDLAALLQSLTGRPLNEASFEAAVDRSREAVRLARTLYRQRCSLGRNVFHAHQMINLLFPLHSLAGTRRLNDTLRALIRDLGDGRRWCRSYGRPLTDPDAVRLVWAHIAPLYDYNSVWGILDDGQRAKIVAEECSHLDLDPDADECRDPFAFVARRLIATPQNGPLERRLERLERIRRESGADAVVHFSHWGCHQAAGAAPLMARHFQAAGVPFLNLAGDCVDSSAAGREQHATRAEAFLESLRGTGGRGVRRG